MIPQTGASHRSDRKTSENVRERRGRRLMMTMKKKKMKKKKKIYLTTVRKG
jgi:hypothetical protein